MKKNLLIAFSGIFFFINTTSAQLPELVNQKIQNLTVLEETIKKTKGLDTKFKKILLFKIAKSKKALKTNKKRGIQKLQIIEKKINQSNKNIIEKVLNSKKSKLMQKYERVGALIQKFKAEGKSIKKLEALQKRMKFALDKL